MNEGSLEINWGFAENMSYASLLSEGYPRITGQDEEPFLIDMHVFLIKKLRWLYPVIKNR